MIIRRPRWSRTIIGLLLLFALTAAHLRVRAGGPAYSGPLLIVDHLYVVLVVALLLGLCTAVGSWMLRKWSLGLDHPIERLSFAAALGGGAVGTGILVCGLLARLDAMFPFLLGCGFLVRREALALPALVRDCVRQLRTQCHAPALPLFALIMLGMLFLAISPPGDWDSLMYHIRIPSRFLHEGRVYLVADNLHTAYVGIPHMLYLPLIALAGQSAPAVFSTLVSALLGLSAFAYCSRFLDRTVASVVLVALWGSPILLLVGVTARIDVTLAWFLFLATYALVIAARERRRDAMLLSGLLIGMAIGIKYLALPFALALVPAVLWAALRSAGGTPGSAAKAALAFGVAALGAALPWMAKNALFFGAPLYPLLAERRMEPWLSDLYGGKLVPPGVNAADLNPLREIRERFNLRDFFIAPTRLNPEGEAAHYIPSPVLVLSPAVILLPGARQFLILLLPGLLYPLLILAPYPYTSLRYLIPAIPFLTIAGTAVTVHLVRRVPRRTRLVAFLLASPALLTLAIRLYLTDAVWHTLGQKSRRDYLFFTRDPTMVWHYKMVETANSLVPTNGRVLLLFEGRGLYFEVPILQDNLLRNWAYLRPLIATGQCLENTGITHVLVIEGLVDHYARRGMDLGKLRWKEFDPFAQKCLVSVVRRPGDYALYRVRGPSATGHRN